MDQPKQDPPVNEKRGGDAKKPGGQPISFVWYLLALFVLLMLGVTLFGASSSVEIPWSDFQALAEASYTPGERDESIRVRETKQTVDSAGGDTREDSTAEIELATRDAGPGWHVYLDKSVNPPRKVRLSNLRELVVGDAGVVGRVTRQVFPPNTRPLPRKVRRPTPTR